MKKKASLVDRLRSLIRSPKRRKSVSDTSLAVVAVADMEPAKPLTPSTSEAKVVPASDKKVAYKCGHEGWEEFKVDLYGEGQISPKKEFLKKRKLCPDCMMADLLKSTIRCAACGLIIFPGEGVALYPKSGKEPAYAVAVKGGVLGCMRWDCCPSGGFLFGTWDGDKMVPAFGGNTMAGEVFATGHPIAVSNTR